MNKIIPSVIEDNGEYYIHMEEYKTLKELVEHYEHLYSEVKKQKDELETSYDILQKNNTTLAKQQEEAYKIADDFCRERQQLKKQKDDVVEYIKNYLQFRKEFDLDKVLRMLGEIDVED